VSTITLQCVSNLILVFFDFKDSTKLKLSAETTKAIQQAVKTGVKPSQIYQNFVRNAENPLDSSKVPNMNQIQYQVRKILLDQLPADGVSTYCISFMFILAGIA
jgi:hypothetical protein